MEIKLYADEWFKAMGLIGFLRVFDFGIKNNIIPDKFKSNAVIKNYGVYLNIDPNEDNFMNYIAKAYFEYAFDRFDRYNDVSEKLNEFLKNPNQKSLSYIKSIIKGTSKDKLNKYFPDTVEAKECDILVKKIDGIKGIDQIEELKDIIEKFLNIVSNPVINEKFTLNYIKKYILSHCFGQTSFLNKAKPNCDKEESIYLFHEDYCAKVVKDLKIQYAFDNINSLQELKKYLKNARLKSPITYTELSKLKNKSMKEIFYETQLKCQFFDGVVGTENFEEKVFAPLGVSGGAAFNFYWNNGQESKTTFPISSLARFIFMFIPFGAAITSGPNYSFIHSSQDFRIIQRINEQYKAFKEGDYTFDDILSSFFTGINQESKYIMQNMFFIQFASDGKKTNLKYYYFPTYITKYLADKDNLKELSKVPYKERQKFLDLIMEGYDPWQFIFSFLYECIKNTKSIYSCYILLKHRTIINKFKQEGDFMKNHNYQLRTIWHDGKQLREALIKNQWDDKKITNYIYKLMNTIRLNNKNDFYQEVMGLYLRADLSMPIELLDIYKEQTNDFQTLASIFLTGLMDKKNYSSKEEQVDENTEKKGDGEIE